MPEPRSSWQDLWLAMIQWMASIYSEWPSGLRTELLKRMQGWATSNDPGNIEDVVNVARGLGDVHAAQSIVTFYNAYRPVSAGAQPTVQEVIPEPVRQKVDEMIGEDTSPAARAARQAQTMRDLFVSLTDWAGNQAGRMAELVAFQQFVDGITGGARGGGAGGVGGGAGLGQVPPGEAKPLTFPEKLTEQGVQGFLYEDPRAFVRYLLRKGGVGETAPILEDFLSDQASRLVALQNLYSIAQNPASMGVDPNSEAAAQFSELVKRLTEGTLPTKNQILTTVKSLGSLHPAISTDVERTGSFLSALLQPFMPSTVFRALFNQDNMDRESQLYRIQVAQGYTGSAIDWLRQRGYALLGELPEEEV